MNAWRDNIGIVLMNSGSPASPDPRDIRPYLIEFLSDKRIVDLPSVVWQPILRGIVSRTRPKKTAPRYRSIWTPEGSPLIVTSLAQRDALNERFLSKESPFRAEIAMRYGAPSVDDAIDGLMEKGFTRIACLPLFPQTSFCTTASCLDAFGAAMERHPDASNAGALPGYAEDAGYLGALAASIRQAWDFEPGDKLLLTFHSIPLSYTEKGDTYADEAQRGMTRLAQILGLDREDWAIAYHSRFDESRAWLSPSPETVIDAWAAQGVRNVVVAAPGFSADCLESLYDLDVVLRERFMNAARSPEASFVYVPALGARSEHIDALEQIIHSSFPASCSYRHEACL